MPLPLFFIFFLSCASLSGPFHLYPRYSCFCRRGRRTPYASILRSSTPFSWACLVLSARSDFSLPGPCPFFPPQSGLLSRVFHFIASPSIRRRCALSRYLIPECSAFLFHTREFCFSFIGGPVRAPSVDLFLFPSLRFFLLSFLFYSGSEFSLPSTPLSHFRDNSHLFVVYISLFCDLAALLRRRLLCGLSKTCPLRLLLFRLHTRRPCRWFFFLCNPRL